MSTDLITTPAIVPVTLPLTSRQALPDLTPELAGIYLTPEEFDAAEIGDDLFHYELIDGVLVVSPIPSICERNPNGELDYMLRQYRDSHPQGASLNGNVTEHYIRLPKSRRRADHVIWASLGRLPNPLVDLPTIVVEFVSKSKRDWYRDYVAKRAEYLALGVKEYWIIDRYRRVMTVFRPEGEVSETIVAENEMYTTPLLPGFELPLAKILVAADQWKQFE